MKQENTAFPEARALPHAPTPCLRVHDGSLSPRWSRACGCTTSRSTWPPSRSGSRPSGASTKTTIASSRWATSVRRTLIGADTGKVTFVPSIFRICVWVCLEGQGYVHVCICTHVCIPRVICIVDQLAIMIFTMLNVKVHWNPNSNIFRDSSTKLRAPKIYLIANIPSKCVIQSSSSHGQCLLP